MTKTSTEKTPLEMLECIMEVVDRNTARAFEKMNPICMVFHGNSAIASEAREVIANAKAT